MYQPWTDADMVVMILSCSPVYDGCPVRILKCPTGLQESDFLELLRSVFPVLQADRPLEFFTANVRRKMFPLRLNTVTPEEILGHVKSRGSCALFLRSKVLHPDWVFCHSCCVFCETPVWISPLASWGWRCSESSSRPSVESQGSGRLSDQCP